jgi:hypothetical protein
VVQSVESSQKPTPQCVRLQPPSLCIRQCVTVQPPSLCTQQCIRVQPRSLGRRESVRLPPRRLRPQHCLDEFPSLALHSARKCSHPSPWKYSHRSASQSSHRSPRKCSHRSASQSSHRSPWKCSHRSPWKSSHRSCSNSSRRERSRRSWQFQSFIELIYFTHVSPKSFCDQLSDDRLHQGKRFHSYLSRI